MCTFQFDKTPQQPQAELTHMKLFHAIVLEIFQKKIKRIQDNLDSLEVDAARKSKYKTRMDCWLTLTGKF